MRKQFQPGVVAIHDQFPFWFYFELRKPVILIGQARCCVRLCKIENYVEEGGNGSGRYGLDSRHGYCRGGRVSSEWHGSAGSYETARFG